MDKDFDEFMKLIECKTFVRAQTDIANEELSKCGDENGNVHPEDLPQAIIRACEKLTVNFLRTYHHWFTQGLKECDLYYPLNESDRSES